jgi:antitoxin (DNA-binding transcriptional repressor) of toxin-antitoxin stability system
MKIVTVHAAKTHLSKLIEKACAGEEVIIARGNLPVVKPVPVAYRKPKRQFGVLKGKLSVPSEFFKPRMNAVGNGRSVPEVRFPNPCSAHPPPSPMCALSDWRREIQAARSVVE